MDWKWAKISKMYIQLELRIDSNVKNQFDTDFQSYR